MPSTKPFDDEICNVNQPKTKQIGFRLPREHDRALSVAAEKRGTSSGLYAREVVLAHLSGFSQFDEINYRLGTIERSVVGLTREFEELRETSQLRQSNREIGELRASLATAAFRFLTEFGGSDSESATEWVVSTFGVSEE